MTKKEAVLVREVWRGEDPNYIRHIAQLPVFPRVGIDFIDKRVDELNRKAVDVAICNLLEEMKNMNHGSDYLDRVKKNIVIVMKEIGKDCERDVFPVIASIKNTAIRCDSALDVASYFNKNGSEELKDQLRSFFDKSGGSRG